MRNCFFLCSAGNDTGKVAVESVELSTDGDMDGRFYLARNLIAILFLKLISWKSEEYSLVRAYNMTGERGRRNVGECRTSIISLLR